MKQFHITFSTAQDMCLNGIVLCGLWAATQSCFSICWVTAVPIRHSSYTLEQWVDSRTSMVIFRHIQPRLMLLPPLLPSLPLTQQWRSWHPDMTMVPSPTILCLCLPFSLSRGTTYVCNCCKHYRLHPLALWWARLLSHVWCMPFRR